MRDYTVERETASDSAVRPSEYLFSNNFKKDSALRPPND